MAKKKAASSKRGRPVSPLKRGRYSFVLPPDLHERLRRKAFEEKKEMSQLVERALVKLLGREGGQ